MASVRPLANTVTEKLSKLGAFMCVSGGPPNELHMNSKERRFSVTGIVEEFVKILVLDNRITSSCFG